MRRRYADPLWKKIAKGVIGTLIPYLGVTFMWNRRVRWPSFVKWGITALVCAASVVAIVLMPMPSNARDGGVKYESSRVDVYGPRRPDSIDTEYIYTSTELDKSVISTAMSDLENNTIYVYVSDNQSFYHAYTCRYAYDSGNRITLYEAYMLGYPPCPLCEPPEYIPADNTGGIQ